MLNVANASKLQSVRAASLEYISPRWESSGPRSASNRQKPGSQSVGNSHLCLLWPQHRVKRKVQAPEREATHKVHHAQQQAPHGSSLSQQL